MVTHAHCSVQTSYITPYYYDPLKHKMFLQHSPTGSDLETLSLYGCSTSVNPGKGYSLFAPD